MSVTSIPVNCAATPDAGSISADKLISGASGTQLWNAFSDKSNQMHVGHWASGPCKLSVNYTEDELCVIVQGSVVLTNIDGDTHSYHTGDAFVIPSGFVGTWESISDVKKIYASFEPA
jgi:uncharacterized cupin superfamily protein